MTYVLWSRVLTRKGVRVEFVKESLVFTGENSPMANFMSGRRRWRQQDAWP